MKSAEEQRGPQGNRELPFMEHLRELRTRLRRALFVVLGVFLATVTLRQEIFELLQRPMEQALVLLAKYQPETYERPIVQHAMHFKDPIEPFFTYLKVSLVAALFLAIPYVLYQAWQFVAPGLYRHERRATLPFVLSSTVMFAAGSAFCYYLVMPFGYYALLAYAGSKVSPMIMMKEYAAITVKLLLAFGLVFETPIFIVFLCRVGLIRPEQLVRFRKQAIVVCAVLAALLTPPDVVTQLLLGIPLYLLYEVSIIGAKLFGKPVPRESDAPPEGEAPAS